MIDKERLLNDKDFYKFFKSGEDLTSFFKQMHKRAVELDGHLDNEKHEKSVQGNYRNGITQKIRSVFPESQTQIYVVHQIRNACRYVIWKDKKQFTPDMKHIYTAVNKQAAELALNDFEEKWQFKYSYAIKSWRDN